MIIAEELATLIDKLQNQASHLMRTYEGESLEKKIIELAGEYFHKGWNAALDSKEKKNK